MLCSCTHAYVYAALWLYQQVLCTMVWDEEMIIIELDVHKQEVILTMDSYTPRLIMSSILNSSVAAAVITAMLMRSGDVESNPGPGS